MMDCDNTLQTADVILTVANVRGLLAIPSEQRIDGRLVYLDGYDERADGGSKLVRWEAGSVAPDNGGTVHAPDPASPGRWVVVHSGVGDYRWFGVFDASRDADDALEALVNDAAIHRIEAHSDLNFAKRHRLRRSGITLDFLGHTVSTNGIELNTRGNPFGAVFFFQGDAAEQPVQTVVLSRGLAELTDVLETADSSAFAVGEWLQVRVDNRPEGGAQRELDYLLLVTELIDATRIRVNYKLGWPLEAGRTLTYRRVRPVQRSHIRDMRFIGVDVPQNGSTTTRPFEEWDQIGSHPVAYEFAVECHVSDITATKVFWPVIERRYCTHYVTERCRLINPEEVVWGGTGYLTQQLNVLYGHVRDCATSNARHLNDFTCAGYCMVENCHGEGDEHGAFVTHGQFEHDLTYIGNSGMLSFANSGTTWGDSAKRIAVRKHVGPRVIAHKKITDLTLDDVHAVYYDGIVDSGTIWANTDGLHMRGCTAETMLTLSQSSSRSKRRNVLDSCTFGMTKDAELARSPAADGEAVRVGFLPVTSEIVVQHCEFHNVDNNTFGSVRRLVLYNTWFRGASPEAGPLRAACCELTVQGGGFRDSGLKLIGSFDPDASDQSVIVSGGAVFEGTNADHAYFSREQATGMVNWTLGDYTSRAPGADIAHFRMTQGRNRVRAFGSTFIGGSYVAAVEAFGGDSYLYMTSCFEEAVDRTGLPPQCGRIRHRLGNMIVDNQGAVQQIDSK